MNQVEISVVMSVYNGADSLAATIDSVLSQTDVNLEFIIVNDGSTDQSQRILEAYAAQDNRIKLFEQSNTGITQALINGCELAQGEFIARQDNGDISLAARLSEQLTLMQDSPNTVMTSTGVRFIAPDGEPLHTIEQSPARAQAGLLARDLSDIEGPPHHGSVMIRKDAYQEAGGYREQFIVAQDLDLWTRLAEIGTHEPTPGVYYQAAVEKNSISSLRRDAQIATTKVIIECAIARETHGNDLSVLESMGRIASINTKVKSSNRTDSSYYYYIGSILATNDDFKPSIKYLKRAVFSDAFNIKAVAKLVLVAVKSMLPAPSE